MFHGLYFSHFSRETPRTPVIHGVPPILRYITRSPLEDTATPCSELKHPVTKSADNDHLMSSGNPPCAFNLPLICSQMEMSSVEIHINLRRMVGYQTHHRLRESTGFKRATVLNDRVFWWSLTCTMAILFVAIGQVVILKKFFSGEPPHLDVVRERKSSRVGTVFT